MAVLIYMIYTEQSTIDIYIIIIGYYEGIVSAFDESMNFISLLKNNDISIERLNSFLSFEENGTKYFGKDKKINKINILECNNVSFKYDNRCNLFNDIACKFEKGKIYAIVGNNGKGKTTLFKLLLGVLHPNSGNILINNKSIYTYQYDQYIDKFSVVNQKPYFFNKSIMENLTYFCNDYNKIIKVCKKLDIHNFIMNLPDKYDTILSEDATNLSGGQKQKLALARALLRDSQILLLDEFTSSLDQKSIEKIFEILSKIKKDKIIIMITHKQAEIESADIVYELKNNKIIEVKK